MLRSNVEMGKQKIKRICIISPGYPTDTYPFFSFVDQLLCAFAEKNVECVVISPQHAIKSIFHNTYRRPVYWERKYHDNSIKVYQPYAFTFSNIHIGKFFVSDFMFEKATIRQFKTLHKQKGFDAIYGHFWDCGLIAAKLSNRFDIPAYVACGESEIPIDNLRRNYKYKDIIRGVVCVSTKNKDECLQWGLCDESKIEVIPNAIDNTLFKKLDRSMCRKQLSIANDAFVVAFVGSFIDRKGSERVAAAINKLEDVFSIFVGSGEKEPNCRNILFKGKVTHSQIPIYLNAADVFVLPTLNEGCCNAIVEAMACGLPIISSDLPFNTDILDDSNSILVDPCNIDEIAEAIMKLKRNEKLREMLSMGAIRKASGLTIEHRATKILDLIESRVSK